LVNELNRNKIWREVYGPENRFMRDQELILRFFALYFNGHNYTAPMKEFLNRFMASNRGLLKIPAEVLHPLFVNTISTIYGAVGRQAFRPARTINTAVFDAVMVGVARRLSSRSAFSIESLRSAHHNLLSNPEFLEITQHSTGHPMNVARRLQMATDAFAGVL
jgi:hypothetical protein